MRRSLLLLFFLALLVFSASAQQYVLSGRITDHKNTPISFSSVYIRNSTYGTTANENGAYQFKLSPGTYNVIYRFVGYKEKTERITISNHDEQHNVDLTDEPFKLIEGKVKTNEKYDPGAGIVQKVIDKREFYLNEVKSYSSAVYIKGVKNITRSPQTLLAKGIKKVLKLDTSGRGISYQSESLSSYSFEQPHKIKEVFAASKIAGINPPFGYNKASDLEVNFYNNLFTIYALNSHGFVSPLASYARFYYKYKLLGTITEDGKRIDKIQVIPRRKSVRSFQGSIYILEGDWRLYSVDLFLTKKENNLTFVDTLKVSQQYIPVKDTWEPISFQYQYQGSVQGIKYTGYYLGIYNHYKIDTTFAKGYFNGEILHVDTEANKRSPAYWADVRPLPLTTEEVEDYHKNDSIAAIQRTRKYQDSMEQTSNRFKIFPYLLKGYLATYKTNRDSLFINSLLQTVYYNTVEGYGIYLKGTYSRTYNDNSSFSISPGFRYGFANKLFSANLHSVYTYDQEHAGKFFFDFGSDLLDLNNIGTRSLYFNTLSTLLSEQNFVKYYRSEFIDFGFQRELTNGVLWMASLSYANRTQLFNMSYNHIFTYNALHYTSNNPLAPNSAPADDRSILFPQNKALILNTSFRFTFDQQYITRPTGKTFLPSLYPVVTVNYRKGINGVFGSDVNYDFVSVDITQDFIPMGLFGHSAFKVKFGDFLNDKKSYFMDYNHFLGNEGTTSDPTYVGSFHFLPFYTFSTDKAFIEAHFQHNFSGAILDNIPLIRELKLEEIVGANYLGENKGVNYSEFYFGVKRLIYGIDYGVSYLGNKKYLQGFRIFIGLK
ncbi:MAG: hypothetical protein JWP44_244 [Mucilaginibacter sp.]|nr:hypothetical protein [Mucilaginibacter sp.]